MGRAAGARQQQPAWRPEVEWRLLERLPLQAGSQPRPAARPQQAALWGRAAPSARAPALAPPPALLPVLEKRWLASGPRLQAAPPPRAAGPWQPQLAGWGAGQWVAAHRRQLAAPQQRQGRRKVQLQTPAVLQLSAGERRPGPLWPGLARALGRGEQRRGGPPEVVMAAALAAALLLLLAEGAPKRVVGWARRAAGTPRRPVGTEMERPQRGQAAAREAVVGLEGGPPWAATAGRQQAAAQHQAGRLPGKAPRRWPGQAGTPQAKEVVP